MEPSRGNELPVEARTDTAPSPSPTSPSPGPAPTVAQCTLSSLLSDPEYAHYPETGRRVLKEFVDLAVERLKDELSSPYLTAPCTLKSLLDAKITVLKLVTEDDFIPRLVRANMAEADPEFAEAAAQLFGMAGELLPMLIEQMEDIAKDLPAFLAQNELTEEQLMLSENVGLSPSLQETYKRGELTIRDVLVHQSAVIFKNR